MSKVLASAMKYAKKLEAGWYVWNCWRSTSLQNQELQQICSSLFAPCLWVQEHHDAGDVPTQTKFTSLTPAIQLVFSNTHSLNHGHAGEGHSQINLTGLAPHFSNSHFRARSPPMTRLSAPTRLSDYVIEMGNLFMAYSVVFIRSEPGATRPLSAMVVSKSASTASHAQS